MRCERWLRKVCVKGGPAGQRCQGEGLDTALTVLGCTYVRTYVSMDIRRYAHNKRMKNVLYSLVFSDVHMVDNGRREGLLSAPSFEG